MHEGVGIAVCVPVRNEAGSLPALLQSMAAQRGVSRNAMVLCLLLDGCEDDSAVVIERARPAFPLAIRVRSVERPTGATVGRARQMAMAMGIAALNGREGGVLMSTDADTVASPDWIIHSLAGLRRADLVTGDIRPAPDGFCARHARVTAYFDRLHLLNGMIDPVPWQARRSHHHAGAASMALRHATYAALGGFPALARGEDAALVTAARYHGFRVRRDAAVVVHTSMRRDGRVENGFATHLQTLDAAGTAETMLVVDPAVAAWQYRGHAMARQSFAAGSVRQLTALAGYIGTSSDAIAALRRTAPNAEAFAVRAVPLPARAAPLPLVEAERRLARLVGHRRAPLRPAVV